MRSSLPGAPRSNPLSENARPLSTLPFADAPTPEQREDIRWAVESLAVRAPSYSKYSRYYDGRHALMIDQRRLRTVFGKLFEDFRLNLCSSVVDALVDRLEVAGFSGPSDSERESADDVWKRNRLDRVSREIHQVAASSGDAYALVWPNREGTPVVYPQDPQEVCVAYAGENPGRVVRAAKLWTVEVGKESEAAAGVAAGGKRVYHRLNLYYPDRIEKYTTPEKAAGDFAKTGVLAGAFRRHETDGEAWPLANTYGEVPVFHFANNGSVGKPGVSELRDAVPVQDWMNYSVFSLLVGQEFQSFPQRYAVGVEVPHDADGKPVNPFVAGPERMWAVESQDGTTASVGQLPAADLEKLISVKQEISLSMAQVTGTPSHYFMLAPGLVSGESQKTAEAKLDSKVADRESAFGETWASLMTLALRMTGVSVSEIECEWADTKPRNELEQWQIADLKVALGVSKSQVLRELGYTEEQIEEFERESREAAAAFGLSPGAFLPRQPGKAADPEDEPSQPGQSPETDE